MLVQSRRNKRTALKLMRKLLKKYGFVPDKLVTDDLGSYAAAASDLGIARQKETSLSASTMRPGCGDRSSASRVGLEPSGTRLCRVVALSVGDGVPPGPTVGGKL